MYNRIAYMTNNLLSYVSTTKTDIEFHFVLIGVFLLIVFSVINKEVIM